MQWMTVGWAGGFFNDNPIYALFSGLYKWDSIRTVSIDEIDTPAATSIYPNLCSESITVKFANDTTISTM